MSHFVLIFYACKFNYFHFLLEVLTRALDRREYLMIIRDNFC